MEVIDKKNRLNLIYRGDGIDRRKIGHVGWIESIEKERKGKKEDDVESEKKLLKRSMEDIQGIYRLGVRVKGNKIDKTSVG